jgi:hypothetical protein
MRPHIRRRKLSFLPEQSLLRKSNIQSLPQRFTRKPRGKFGGDGGRCMPPRRMQVNGAEASLQTTSRPPVKRAISQDGAFCHTMCDQKTGRLVQILDGAGEICGICMPDVPIVQQHDVDTLCAARRLCMAPDAARSAPLADGLSGLSCLAPGRHVAAHPRSAPRYAPHPHGASPPTVGRNHRCPDGEDHRTRGPHGDDGAKKLNGRTRHLLVETTGLPSCVSSSTPPI